MTHRLYYLRSRFIDFCLDNYNEPYVYGAQGADQWDCSGLAIEALKSVELLPASFDDTADGLMRRYAHVRVSTAQKGCLVFYGSADHATHIAIAVNPKFVIGAHGGNIRKVQIVPIDYRDDILMVCDPFATYGPVQS